MDFSEKGVYCLVFENRGCVVEVGKKGTFSFPEGFHIYVGSALGSGGMKRVKRHIELSLKKDKNPRWHVDYLHLNPSFKLLGAVCASTSDRFECKLLASSGVIQLLCSGSRIVPVYPIFFTEDKIPFLKSQQFLKHLGCFRSLLSVKFLFNLLNRFY